MVKQTSKDIDRELIELKHQYKMEELDFERKTHQCIHQWRLEEMRIKNAEIKRHFLRKDNFRGGN